MFSVCKRQIESVWGTGAAGYRQSATEREIIKVWIATDSFSYLTSLSLLSTAMSREWNHYCHLSPILSRLVVTLSVSQVVSSPACSHCELMCCHPGLTATSNSLRLWMKSILQEPLKPVGVILLSLPAVSSVCIIVCLAVHCSFVYPHIRLHAVSYESLFSLCFSVPVISYHKLCLCPSPLQSAFDPFIF